MLIGPIQDVSVSRAGANLVILPRAAAWTNKRLTGGHLLKNLLAGRMTSTTLVIRNGFPRTALVSAPCNTHLARKYPGRLLIEGDSTIGSLRLLPRPIIISLEVTSIKQWRGIILKTTRAATSPGGPLLKPGPLVLAQLVTTRRTVSVRQTLAGT